jgi:hypothetical protein
MTSAQKMSATGADVRTHMSSNRSKLHVMYTHTCICMRIDIVQNIDVGKNVCAPPRVFGP